MNMDKRPLSKMNSSDIKHKLYDEVFHPNGERLTGFLQVAKTEPGLSLGKKENIHYLCASVTVKRPNQAYILRYRSNDEGKLERRRIWKLEELVKVDGKTDTSSKLEFILIFDKEFKFQALNEKDKNAFLREVATMCSKYTSTNPTFDNVDSSVQEVYKKSVNLSSQLHQNKEALAERGDKLNQTEKATADMAKSAENFSTNTHKLSEKYSS